MTTELLERRKAKMREELSKALRSKEELLDKRNKLLEEHGIDGAELYRLNDIGGLSDEEYSLYVQVRNIDFALESFD